MLRDKIKNWKLVEIIENLEYVAEDSADYRCDILEILKLPTPTHLTGLIRSETEIDWEKMPIYYKLCFDDVNPEIKEEQIRKAFINSELSRHEKIIIPYGWKEPVIKVPTKFFLEDWEGFVRSTMFETIIFSEDFSLIIEISKDYHIHSNFEILPNTKQ